MLQKLASITIILYSGVHLVATASRGQCICDEELKPFEISDAVDTGASFKLKLLNASWYSDVELQYGTYGAAHTFNVVTGITTKLYANLTVNHSKLTKSKTSRYVLENNGGYYSIHEIATGKLISVHTPGEELETSVWTKYDQNKDQLIFIKSTMAGNNDTNIYMWREEGGEKRLTYYGLNTVLGDCWQVSPNGEKLAYETCDQTNIEWHQFNRYPVTSNATNSYSKTVTNRYTKPGTKQCIITLAVVDVARPENKVTIPAPVYRVTGEQILVSLKWISNDFIIAVWHNRVQDVASYQKCNVRTSNCEEIVAISRPNGWIDSYLACVAETETCFYLDDADNVRHVFAFDIHGNATEQVTQGNYTVRDILGYKPTKTDLFYSAVPLNNPEQLHVYRNNMCITCGVLTPEGNNCTNAEAVFSPNDSYYVLTCIAPDPPFVKIFNAKTNAEVLSWESNAKFRRKYKRYQPIQTVYLRVPVTGGFQAAVKLLLPIEIDVEAYSDDVEYPMIVDVYGGPTSNQVDSYFDIDLKNYLVTKRKVIYATIDGRGTQFKGQDMLYAAKHKFGSLEIEDQIAVTKYLRAKYDFIDGTRIGIYGWSYGGYATTMVLAKDIQRVFVGGIAVAPVTSWFYYNSYYTEKFMGMPTKEDNLQGYLDSDVTLRAKAFAHHKLLLIHGTADSNVHFEHAMLLSRALQKEGILFEQMSYPDEGHVIRGPHLHLVKTMVDFWERHFNLTDSGDDDDD